VTRWREQVALALRAVRVRSSTSYAWFGHAARPLTAAQTIGFDASVLREYLVDRLQEELYRSFYGRGRPVPFRPEEAPPVRPDPAFVEALSACNAGRGGWEPGWRVAEADGPTLLVARDGLHVRVPASECQPKRPASGTFVSVRRPNEHRAVSPGFYFARSDADHAGDDEAVEVRTYFHLAAAGAAPLIATATRLLNRARLPFGLKVIDHPDGFVRCDAGVLYLRKGDFAKARGPLQAIVSACAPHLRPQAPAFTKPLGCGVAVGEHLPRDGGSFGISRCRLVAEGIVTAHERGASGLSDRIDAVARRFAERGLDLDIPYLAPKSSDGYEL
jgi:class II lanthipeptide synthase